MQGHVEEANEIESPEELRSWVIFHELLLAKCLRRRYLTMPLVADFLSAGAGSTISAVAVLSLLYTLHNVYLHPLSSVPGPLIARCSELYLLLLCYLGIEGRVIRKWHQQYGTRVLRVAPNSISLSDPDNIKDIYITSGGYMKDARYQNFNLGPIATIFSAIDTEYRDVRAKAVAPLFSTARLRAATQPDGAIGSAIDEFVDQLKNFKAAKLRMDLLDVTARLSIDLLTNYLFGERYGGLAEHAKLSDMKDRQNKKLSANHFIFAIVGWSRFSLLPNWLFTRVYPIYARYHSPDLVGQSFAILDQFAQKIMRNVTASASHQKPKLDPTETYHGRLMDAGIPAAEASAQAKATVFAGTDSSSVMLTTILFHLVQHPEVRENILAEISTSDSSVDPRTLPWLRASVKEGLRMGMANPTRLTRVVPASGLRVGSYQLPGGTVVGMAASTLHYDPDVFPDPFAFRPERWLENGLDKGLRRLDMDKSILSFGAGLRACIGKNLAQQQLYETVRAVIESKVFDGARTCKDHIEMIEWFNGEIVGHHLDIEWD